MKTYFAAALLTATEAVKLHMSPDTYLDYVPNAQEYRFEYPDLEGHLAQDYYDGRRKTVHHGDILGENFDYYPIPHGIDYDDFYPGFSYFNPNELHHYKDYSNSDGNSFDSYSS